MTEDGGNDAMFKEKFEGVIQHLKNKNDLNLRTDSTYAQAIIWASERIAKLESRTQSPETSSDKVRDVFLNLGYGDRIESRKNNKALTWAQRQFLELELENRSLSNTVRNLSKSPQLASPDSDEEIYERQERERLLDEIRSWGHLARDLADKICWAIDEFDAEE